MSLKTSFIFKIQLRGQGVHVGREAERRTWITTEDLNKSETLKHLDRSFYVTITHFKGCFMLDTNTVYNKIGVPG